MYKEDIALKLKPLLSSHLEKSGYVLEDLRFYRARGELIFEILVDRVEGGISLDECGRFNRELRDMIEQSGILLEPYMLDVSSPGLDRPLVTAHDFKRAMGREVRIFLREAVEDKIEYMGHIESVSENKIVIKTKEKTVEIPLDKVNKAKQVIL